VSITVRAIIAVSDTDGEACVVGWNVPGELTPGEWETIREAAEADAVETGFLVERLLQVDIAVPPPSKATVMRIEDED